MPGKRRATSLTARKAWLSISTSLTYVRARPGRSGGSSVRSSVRVSATSACGKVQNSKWSCASARSCRLSSTGSSGSGLSVWRRRNAGTQRSVTAAITPSAPSETRAASSSSPPSIVRSLPSASTSSTHSTWPERFGSLVPCRACRSRARPRATGRRCRRGWASPGRAGAARARAPSGRMPASTRTSRAVDVEHAVERVEREQRAVGHRAGAERVPGAGDAHRARAVGDRAAASSARVRGRSKRAGVARCEPDQLTHSTPRTVPSADGRRAGAGGRAAAGRVDPADRHPRALRVGGRADPGRALSDDGRADARRRRRSTATRRWSSTAASAGARRWRPTRSGARAMTRTR